MVVGTILAFSRVYSSYSNTLRRLCILATTRGSGCVIVPSSTGAKRPKKPIGSQLTAAISAWATFYRPGPARFGVVGPYVTPLARLFRVLEKLGANVTNLGAAQP